MIIQMMLSVVVCYVGSAGESKNLKKGKEKQVPSDCVGDGVLVNSICLEDGVGE